MPRAPIFLDSNVFIYAAGREHPLRAPCRAALQRVSAGAVLAATSSEVVQEILHVVSRQNPLKAAIEVALQALELVPEVLPVRREEVTLACALLHEAGGVNTRDAIHVATMRLNGLTEILTADRHFAAIEGVRRLDPATWVLA